jgi:hypothetical protein
MCLTRGHVLTVYTEIAIFDHQHYLTITICCPWMRWSVWICGTKLLGRQLRSWYLCQAIPRFTQGISSSCKQSRTRATQRYILVTMWDSRISCTISSIYKRQYSAQNQIVFIVEVFALLRAQYPRDWNYGYQVVVTEFVVFDYEQNFLASFVALDWRLKQSRYLCQSSLSGYRATWLPHYFSKNNCIRSIGLYQ